jgi:ribosomal-protein-serine acetyltransferase
MPLAPELRIGMSPEESCLNARNSTVLRPVSVDHAPFLFALVDANRSYLRQWLPWLDGCRCEEDQRSFLASVVQRGRNGRGAVWLVEQENLICGVAGFNWIEPINRVCEIGYWLAESYQHRGIMTACVSRLVKHAFTDLGLNRITIPVAVENQRSRAIPARLGFKIEGVLREAEWLYGHYVDHALYAQVRSDWIAQQGRDIQSAEQPPARS